MDPSSSKNDRLARRRKATNQALRIIQMEGRLSRAWKYIGQPKAWPNRGATGPYEDSLATILDRLATQHSPPGSSDGTRWESGESLFIECMRYLDRGYQAKYYLPKLGIDEPGMMLCARLDRLSKTTPIHALLHIIRQEQDEPYEDFLATTERLAQEVVRSNLQGEHVRPERLDNAWRVIHQLRGTPRRAPDPDDEKTSGSDLAAIGEIGRQLGQSIAGALAGRVGPPPSDDIPIDIEARHLPEDQPEASGVARPQLPALLPRPEPLASGSGSRPVPAHRGRRARRQEPLRGSGDGSAGDGDSPGGEQES